MKPLRWTTLLLAFVVCASGPRGAEAAPDKAPPTKEEPIKVSPFAAAALETARAGGPAATGANLTTLVRNGDETYSVYHVEFKDDAKCKNFAVKGTHLITRVERFADFFVLNDKDVKAAVEKAPGIAWIDVEWGTIVPPPPPDQGVKEKTKSVPEATARGGVGDWTGKGVIIAVIDTGIDFRHDEFITFDAAGKPTSRVLYFWDTTATFTPDQKIGSKAPVSYPNGASLGVVYSREELTNELRGAKKLIPPGDIEGHGTACASLAAGNSTRAKPAGDDSGKPVGVAPDADLIAVRLGKNGVDNAYLLGAICEWLDKKAAKTPLVVSCSYGGWYGGRDGFQVLERQLDQRFPEKGVSGRAICIAAGNDGYRPIHAEIAFRPGKAKEILKWAPSKNAKEPPKGAMLIELYTDTADPDALRVESKEPSAVARKYVHGLTDKVVFEVLLQPGPGEFTVINAADKKIAVDAYIIGYGIGTGGLSDGGFDDTIASRSKQITTPATAGCAIAVGSYDFNDVFHMKKDLYTFKVDTGKALVEMVVGARSHYSNPGYTRLGAVKPDITSPGQYFTAAAPPKEDVPPDTLLYETSERYQLFNGTSAATPYTAGVIALIMQKKPTITLGEIKKLLKDHAASDKQTDKLPNPKWGNGKLTYQSVKDILAAAK
jgi:subtilisin family serine protease